MTEASDESDPLIVAHRTISAAVKGFDPNVAMTALAMTAAQIIVTYCKPNVRANKISGFVKALRQDCRNIDDELKRAIADGKVRP
jgi:hypothetical protein